MKTLALNSSVPAVHSPVFGLVRPANAVEQQTIKDAFIRRNLPLPENMNLEVNEVKDSILELANLPDVISSNLTILGNALSSPNKSVEATEMVRYASPEALSQDLLRTIKRNRFQYNEALNGYHAKISTPYSIAEGYLFQESPTELVQTLKVTLSPKHFAHINDPIGTFT